MIVNRAFVIAENPARKGYHHSHVVTPYVKALASSSAIASLRRFDRYQPLEPIVWHRAGRGLYWSTLKADTLEHELLNMARRRARGLRQSIATLSRWTGSSRDSVTRALKALERRGAGLLEIGRGRYAVAVFRAVGVNHATNSARAATLIDESARSWARYSEAEQIELEADAYRWRVGLARSLEAVGFTGPDAESDYLAFMARITE